MKKATPLKIIAAILLVSVVTSYGCILNPESDPEPRPHLDIPWPDLSTPDDVVETIRLVYKHFNTASTDELMSHYAAVLYDDPNQVHDYVWNMQPADVTKYGDVMLREEDIEGTEFVLERASALDLTIAPGSWYTAEDVCDECLVTTRVYSITATLEIEGVVESLAGLDMEINLVIGPNEQVPGTWVIYIASDLPGQNPTL